MNGTPSAGATLLLARVSHVMVTDDTLAVDLEDGRTISVPIGWYPRLAHGTPPSAPISRLAAPVMGSIGWISTRILVLKDCCWAKSPQKAPCLSSNGYSDGNTINCGP